MANDRVKTGIDGLDKMLNGGIARGLNVMLNGGPGTGKTTMAMQYLVAGATKYNEPGMIITMHSAAKDLIKFYKPFGWDIEKLVREKKLVITEMDIIHLEDNLEKVNRGIANEIKANGIKRVVKDSLSALGIFFRDEFKLNEHITKLVSTLKDLECTSLMTVETPMGSQEGMQIINPNAHSLISYNSHLDGVIELYNMRIGNTRNRAVEVMKMRSTDHDKDLRPFKITDSGIVVFPDQVLFSK